MSKQTQVGAGSLQDVPRWVDNAGERNFVDKLDKWRGALAAARDAVAADGVITAQEQAQLDRAKELLTKAKQTAPDDLNKARDILERAQNAIRSITPDATPAASVTTGSVTAPANNSPAVTATNSSAVPAGGLDASGVAGELSELRGQMNKLEQLGKKAGMKEARFDSVSAAPRYLLNLAGEALRAGKTEEANTLIGNARGLIGELAATVSSRAEGAGKGSAASMAVKIGQKAQVDSTPGGATTTQQLVATAQSIAPSSVMGDLNARIIAAGNASNAARRQGLNSGSDTSGLDAKADKLLARAQTALNEGRVSTATRLLGDVEQIVKQARGVAGEEAKAGQPDLTLNAIVRTYKQMDASDLKTDLTSGSRGRGEDYKGTSFLRTLITRMGGQPEDYGRGAGSNQTGSAAPLTGGEQAAAAKVGSQKISEEGARILASAYDRSRSTNSISKPTGSDDEASRPAAKPTDWKQFKDMTVLEFLQEMDKLNGGYSTTATDWRGNSNAKSFYGVGYKLDDLYSKVVLAVGGKGAMDGSTLITGEGGPGTLRGTMFNDTLMATGKPEGRINIDGRGGDDTITVSSQTPLAGVRIDGGGGNDVITASGQMRKLRISGGEGRDTLVAAGNFTKSRVDGDGGRDQIQVVGNFDKGVVDGGGDSDQIYVNAGAAYAKGNVTNSKIIAGGGKVGGDDVITIGGGLRNTTIDLNEGWRDNGTDTLQVLDTVRGKVKVADNTHSTASWNGKNLRHDDQIVLLGKGWSEKGDMGEAGNALLRKDADGKTAARINLGTGAGDGQIEKIFVMPPADAKDTEIEVFRNEMPELFAKPFGVTAGAWAMTIMRTAASIACPPVGVVFAGLDMFRAIDSGDFMNIAMAGLGMVASVGGVALQGASLAGSSTYGMSAKTLGTFQDVVKVSSDLRRGLSVVDSFTDGKIMPTDIINAASFAAGYLPGADDLLGGFMKFGDGKSGFSNADLNQVLDLGGTVVGSFENGKFDPTGLIQYAAGQVGGTLRDDYQNLELDKSARHVMANPEKFTPEQIGQSIIMAANTDAEKQRAEADYDMALQLRASARGDPLTVPAQGSGDGQVAPGAQSAATAMVADGAVIGQAIVASAGNSDGTGATPVDQNGQPGVTLGRYQLSGEMANRLDSALAAYGVNPAASAPAQGQPEQQQVSSSAPASGSDATGVTLGRYQLSGEMANQLDSSLAAYGANPAVSVPAQGQPAQQQPVVSAPAANQGPSRTDQPSVADILANPENYTFSQLLEAAKREDEPVAAGLRNYRNLSSDELAALLNRRNETVNMLTAAQPIFEQIERNRSLNANTN